MSSPTIRPVPEGRYVTLANGHRIHLLDQGQGPVVVFLHGSGNGACGYSNFKHNYPEVVKAGCRAVLPDLIGFGYSDKPPERVERLVLMAPGGLNDLPDYLAMPGMATMFSLYGSGQPPTEERMREFFKQAFVVDPAVVTDDLVHERSELAKLQIPQVMKTLKVPNLTGRLPEIQCPALSLWGMNEKMMPESGILRLAKGLKNGRMVLVPNCGHWVMIEHRDLFNRMLLDFLRHG